MTVPIYTFVVAVALIPAFAVAQTPDRSRGAVAQSADFFASLADKFTVGDTVIVINQNDAESRGLVSLVSPASLRVIVNGTPRNFAPADVRAILIEKRAIARGAQVGVAIGAGVGIALAALFSADGSGYAYGGVLLAMLVVCAVPASAGELVIVHTNDTHSNIFPFGPPKEHVGIARVSTVIKQLREQNDHVLSLVPNSMRLLGEWSHVGVRANRVSKH